MKRFNKTVVVFLAVVLCMSLLLSACGGSAPTSQQATSGKASEVTQQAKKEKVTIDFQAHWGSVTRRPIIEKMVSDFNASQDGIKAKYMFVPYGDIWTKNAAAVAAGNPCDVIVNEIPKVGLRAKAGQMESLTPFISKEKESIKDRFFENLYNTCQYNNEVYALPFNTDTRIMFWNKDAFKEVGLDPEKGPQTWEELVAFSDKLDKKNGEKIERLGFFPLITGGNGWENWLMNADKGLQWFDYANGEKPTINTPAKLEALEWLKTWKGRHSEKSINSFQAEFGQRERNAFLAGKVAIYMDVATFYTQIRDFNVNKINWGVGPIPEKTKGSGNWSWGGGFDVEIPKGSKHVAEAWEFIKYMTDTDAQKYWAQYNFDIVANKKACNDETLLKEVAYKAAVDNMKWTIFTPFPLKAPDFSKLVTSQYDAFILGKQDAKTALEKAQKDVEELIKLNTK